MNRLTLEDSLSLSNVMAFSPASLSEDGDGTNRRTSTSDPDKICRVCGDRAIGYNFGIVACESCKSFFRRQAARADELRCPFNDCCEINIASRRFCQSCRLKKCFVMGMCPDLLKKSDRDGAPKKRTRIAHKDIDEILVNDNSDDEVTVSKGFLAELVRKSKTGEKMTACICKCRCGFYPTGTRLTASSSSSQPPSPASLQNHGALPRRPRTPKTIEDPHMNPIDSPQSSTTPNNSRQTAVPEIQKKPQLPFPSGVNGGPPNFDWYLHNSRIPGGIDLSWYNTQLQNGLQSMPPLQQQSSIPQTFAHSLPFGNGFPQMFAGLPFGTQSEQTSSISYAPPHNLPTSTSLAAANMIRPIGNSKLIDLTPTASSVIGISKYQKLADEDRYLLEELLLANELLKEPLELGFMTQEELTVMDVVGITNLALRRIIMMAKKLEGFTKLNSKDQVTLMKGGSTELLILRGVMAYDVTKNTWNYQGQDFSGSKEMQVKVEILKQTPVSRHFDEHLRFLASFTEKLRKNDHVMTIMNAIVLFSPDRPNLEDPEAVRRLRNKYNDLLLKVLQCEFSANDSRQMYETLLKRLVDLSHIKLGFVSIYLGLDPTKLDPLILELLDIQGPFAQNPISQ